MARPKDPHTPDEWQLAADFAQTCLLLESARQYGLVTGGPVVHVARCEAILARALALGIRPTDEGIDAAIAAIVAAPPAS